MTEPELPAVPDIEAMLAALERARAVLSPQDHALLAHAVALVAATLALLREHDDDTPPASDDDAAQTTKPTRK
jgi:hypothetical protein